MTENTNDSDAYFETDIGAKRGDPAAVAGVFEAIAETMEDAPADRRYDITVTINERQ